MGLTNILYTYCFIYFLGSCLRGAVAYHCPHCSCPQDQPTMVEMGGGGEGRWELGTGKDMNASRGRGNFFEVKKREVYFFAKLPSHNCSKTEGMFFTKLIFNGEIVSHTKRTGVVSCGVVTSCIPHACMHVSGGTAGQAHAWRRATATYAARRFPPAGCTPNRWAIAPDSQAPTPPASSGTNRHVRP
jgi:hypothetical protein